MTKPSKTKKYFGKSLFEFDAAGNPLVKEVFYSKVSHPPIDILPEHVALADQCRLRFLEQQGKKNKGKKYKGDPENCVVSQAGTDHFEKYRGVYGEFVGMYTTGASVRIEFKDRVVVYANHPALKQAIKDWDAGKGWTFKEKAIILQPARQDNLNRKPLIKGNKNGRTTTLKVSRGVQGRAIPKLRAS